MSKNKGLGLVSALAVGAGVAAVAAGKKYKTAETKKKEDYDALHNTSEYRNTERGKYEKNSKGIYYTNGNYEAFARPRKPEGVDDKHAYIVGSGLASLAAACFLVRDGQMPGKNIHILEAMDIAGGACDGIFDPSRGYVMRGGREMENHFECLWDLFRSIPSIETPGVSVLDEYYWLNKEDPNYSLCRATKERGKDAHTDGKFNLSQKGCMEIMKLFMTKDEDLYDKTIEDVFDDEVFDSTFWLYWRTMFAFENWHSALEMKLYFQRFIHHISGLPDFSALKFTKYNQYESLILPMQKYLEEADVVIYAGSLVNPQLLEYTKENCEIYNSAKMTLEEVLEVMEQAEREQKMTVRLHTGDPCLYGAIREQMDHLDELGIAYDSCPGVSSFCGAAAALNLEYTLPEVSQSVVITRMEGRTPVPAKEKVAAFASHNATMVLFLSTGLLEKLVKELLAGGYASDTPAAIVYKATWPEEESYICTVSTLAETAKAHGITKTALIIVGDVVTHHAYERSKLYDPEFTTEFRQGVK